MADGWIETLKYAPPSLIKRILSGFLWEGTPDSMSMALTFDDGPDPEITPAVLDSLDALGARGTFFMVGENVSRYPSIARLVSERGHLIGNHSMTHQKMFLLRKRDVEREVDSAEKAIEDATGVKPGMFRPPYGMFDFTCASVVHDRGLTMVLWTVLSGDFSENPPEEILSRVKPHIRPGAIMVFHDTAKGGGKILPDLISDIGAGAKKENIRLGGIDELSVSSGLDVDEGDDD
jgi:peptidoglycan-N-acetylglucosamine deacetylase